MILSCGGQALARIDQKHDSVGLVYRLQGLPRHLVQDAVLGHRLETAGIHHQIGPVAHPAMAVMAVARQPRQVRNQGVAASG